LFFESRAKIASPGLAAEKPVGTGNRLGRVVDRTRVVASGISTFAPGSPEREAWTMQLQTLQIRANLLLKSLRCFYAGLGLFAASALLTAVLAV
jgi:hypothetical protein